MVLDVVNKFRCWNSGRGIYKLTSFTLVHSTREVWFVEWASVRLALSLPGIVLCNTIYISLFTLCFDEIHMVDFYFVT